MSPEDDASTGSDRPERVPEPSGTGSGGAERSPGMRALRVAGLVLLALALVVAFLRYGPRPAEEPPAEPIPVGAAGTGARGGPLSPREAADELFNRAMSAVETGDSVGAARFVPMALTAYRGLESLDLDARYHLAVLYLASGRPEAANAQADTILQVEPDHLLGLHAAASAYGRLGRTERAAELYRRYLEVYSPDLAESRPEYRMHEAVVSNALEEARRVVEAAR